MKSLIVWAVAATALLGSASAQLIPSDNVSAKVSFFYGDPTDGGTELTTVPMNNSPVGNVVSGIESQNHVVVVVNGSSYSLKTLPGGNSKFSVYLDRGEGTRPVSLAEVLDRLVTEPDYLEKPGS